MQAFAERYAAGPPTLRDLSQRPGSITSLQLLFVLLALVPGAAVATLGIALVDNLTADARVPAVVTANVADLDEDGFEYQRTLARADDGRALDLGTGVPALRGEPVVATLSTATDRLVAVRTADEWYQPHRTNAYAFLVVVLLATLLVTALLVRRTIRTVPWTALVMSAVTGFLIVGVWQLNSTAALADAPTLPASTGMGIYDDAEFFPATGVRTGQPLQVHDVTLQVAGPVTRGAPAGAASWLNGFTVLVVPFDASYDGTSTEDYVPLALIGSGSGKAEPVAAEHCGPDGFDGHVPAGTVRGLMCFVTPPDFQPRHIIVGTGESQRIDVTGA
ncbi:hypothetical protein [Actinoplanes sp. DH11]|uniref:hypothetical protein n=1 Tax=Actinoplanes sp. DH11 TaxID=2857011 RepID=UPI001E64AB48|nr:hypothetical protein [Actinoplanes sp. DH11]